MKPQDISIYTNTPLCFGKGILRFTIAGLVCIVLSIPFSILDIFTAQRLIWYAVLLLLSRYFSCFFQKGESAPKRKK